MSVCHWVRAEAEVWRDRGAILEGEGGKEGGRGKGGPERNWNMLYVVILWSN